MIPRGTPPYRQSAAAAAEKPPRENLVDVLAANEALAITNSNLRTVFQEACLDLRRLRILVLLQRHVQQEFRRMALELLELLDHERAHPLASSCWNDPREAREREIRRALSEIQRSESQP